MIGKKNIINVYNNSMISMLSVVKLITLIFTAVFLYQLTFQFVYSLNLDEPVNINNDITGSYSPQIYTKNSDTIYILWTGIGSGEEKQDDIFFKKSTDRGKNFDDTINLSNSPGSSFNPKASISDKGIYVVWEDDTFAKDNTTIFFKKSNDNGNTFIDTSALSRISLDSSNPQIVSNGNNISVVWEDGSTESSKVLFKRSIDDGKNFIESLQISGNDQNSYAIDSYAIDPQIRTEDNYVYVIWSEMNRDHTVSDLFIKYSKNYGDGFGKATKLDFNPGLALNAKIKIFQNNVYVVWEDNIQGKFQIYLTKSSDGGSTFADPINLSNSTGDSINPQIDLANNKVYVIWQDNSTKNYEVITTSSTDGGSTFADPINMSNSTGDSINPKIGTLENAAFVVWEEGEAGASKIYINSVA